MRYIKFLVASVALVVAAACVNSEVDDRPIVSVGSNGELQVVGRITQFSDCDVATRSKKEGDEPKVTSMGLALFPIVNNTIGNCLYYDYEAGSSIVFVIERDLSIFDNYEGIPFAMYIFANMQGADGFPTTDSDGVGKSLDYFMSCSVSISSDVENIPDNGFPMMGSLGNTIDTVDGDGTSFILKPTPSGNNIDGLPLIGGSATDNLEIPLTALYSKFSFTISVKPDQEIIGNKAPRFDLLSYAVNNIAKTVDSKSATNSDTDVIDTSGDISVGNYAQGATTATFDFYLPERYLKPSITKIDDVLPTELQKGTYDKAVDKDQNGYRDEDEKYHQRYKNKLVGQNQKATYVTINGKYTDHQGHAYDVAYNIYLGGNNYDNFDVIRNTHYDNSVTIRGISASDDQATNTNGIAIDWRVNVERSTPLVINLRRESLLDAHFEVRPLRLRLVGDNIPTGTSATVTILNEDGTANNVPGWIRLEASGNSTDHITSGVSAGKRKYFTVDLVTKTLAANTSITVSNLTANNQTLWIYVDENTDTKSRAAIVRITYDGVNKDYKIVQNGLYSVVGADSGNTYYIEQYEEYLYNYDAEDSYGQTKQEGMPWGLNTKQLSNKYTSFDTDKAGTDWKSDYTSKYPLPYYDFYIGKHDDDNDSSDEYTKDGGTLHNYAGQEFTKEIAENPNAGLTKLTLAETANSAVEYCYNRNKRDANGNVVNVEWYLPSADELEDFIVPAYASFEEFQDNYYWTSQPAYIRNVFYYEHKWYGSWLSEKEEIYAFTIYEDNTEYARATKVVYANGEYNYAPSGLDSIPTPRVDNRAKRGESGATNLGYFYMMRYWKYNERAITNRKDYGQDKRGIANAIADGIDVTNGDYDEFFNDTKDNKRYYVHLGHLYNMIQKTENNEHGYHPRTKSNRVRCVRKVTQNQQ